MKVLSSIILLLSIIFIKDVYASVTYKINEIIPIAADNVELTLSGLIPPKNVNTVGYLNEVKKQTIHALNAVGYYQSSIAIKVIKDVVASNAKDERHQVVSITINLGPRVIIKELYIKIIGAAKDDKHFLALLDKFIIKKNDPLDSEKYEEAKASLSKLAQRYGYFKAHFKRSIVEVTKKSASASIYLWFDSGPRYKFGQIHFAHKIDANNLIKPLAKFKTGDYFDTNDINQFNSAINDTGYFSSSNVFPNINQTNKDLEVPLDVILQRRTADSFGVGIGYASDSGVRGKFSWIRPWVNRYGHSIEGHIVASMEKQEASLVYKIPLEDALYNYMSFKTAYKLLNQNDTDTTEYIVGLNRYRLLSNKWFRNTYIRYDAESGRQGAQDFSTKLILPGISFSRMKSEGGVNATSGNKQLIYFEFANKILLSSSNVAKVYMQSKWLRTYAGHQFVFSVMLGAIGTKSIYNTPASMRFFAGGDQSIRGFAFETISPKDSSGFLAGGKYLTTANFEYRFPIAHNWKIATFYDIGTATSDFSEPISKGTGLGIVWGSPVGPLRFYVGVPLTQSDENFTIHLRIGPEL
ncbi:MAG: outer membrane protein assembly factor [Psychromonas sp.]|nr:outer membrane protein assembly factor [Psychromonas sp.]